MGVSGPFKGSRREWLDANGFRHEVVASEGKFELRWFPDQVPRELRVGVRGEDRSALVTVERARRGGWRVYGVTVDVPAHESFDDPIGAFRWWATLVSDSR